MSNAYRGHSRSPFEMTHCEVVYFLYFSVKKSLFFCPKALRDGQFSLPLNIRLLEKPLGILLSKTSLLDCSKELFWMNKNKVEKIAIDTDGEVP